MAPPTFADLGKSSRDLFSKGYHIGLLKAEATTKTNDGLEIKSNAAHNIASGNLGGGLDLKYKLPEYGLTLTEKWNTENVIGTELVVQDKGVNGLKVTVDQAYSVPNSKRSGKVKLDFAQERFRATMDGALEPSPVVNAAVVAEHQGWHMGVSAGVDTKKNALKSNSLALGRFAPDYSLHAFLKDTKEFNGHVYHRVNRDLEVGANVAWTRGENATGFALAAKYQFAPETVLRAKASSKAEVGFGMTHSLSRAMKLNLSGIVSLANYQEQGHKFGLGLEYNP